MKDREHKFVKNSSGTHIHSQRLCITFSSSFFLLSGEYMLACPLVKGSRLQRVVLFFFFFFSRLLSNVFFYLNKTFSALVHACICSLCVLCLAAAMTDQMQSMYVSPLCCLFLLVFFSLLLFLYQAQVNERRRTNGSFSFF